MTKLETPPSKLPLCAIIDKRVINNSTWMTWFFNAYKKITGSVVQELTATGGVTEGIESLELNHASTIIAATIANSKNHPGLFIVKDTSASGTAAHTCTLTAGTWDGTNTIATLNAPGEALAVYFDSNGDGVIIENIGSVALT